MPTRSISTGSTKGTVYREVARLRLVDAGCLMRNNRRNGAVYIAGYAVECQLKYAYCKRHGLNYLPGDLETHDWDVLLDAAGLRKDLQRQLPMAAVYSGLVQLWGPNLRYQTKSYAQREANRLYNEVKQLYDFLDELVL